MARTWTRPRPRRIHVPGTSHFVVLVPPEVSPRQGGQWATRCPRHDRTKRWETKRLAERAAKWYPIAWYYWCRPCRDEAQAQHRESERRLMEYYLAPLRRMSAATTEE